MTKFADRYVLERKIQQCENCGTELVFGSAICTDGSVIDCIWFCPECEWPLNPDTLQDEIPPCSGEG